MGGKVGARRRIFASLEKPEGGAFKPPPPSRARVKKAISNLESALSDLKRSLQDVGRTHLGLEGPLRPYRGLFRPGEGPLKPRKGLIRPMEGPLRLREGHISHREGPQGPSEGRFEPRCLLGLRQGPLEHRRLSLT